MKRTEKWIIDLITAAFCAAVCAVCLGRWTSGDFWVGFRAAFFLGLPLFFLLFRLWTWAGREKQLLALILICFGLRFSAGLVTQNLLPIWGHPDEARETAGFLFDDAYRRNEESWAAAHKEDLSFFGALTRAHHNDQYGAMVTLGIWIYQYLSPDSPRFSLLMLIGALFTALGLPFFREGLKEVGNIRLVNVACWIYALYPDSIFYAASPMREPFLIGILAAAFWALTRMKRAPRSSIAFWLLCTAASLPFSHLIGEALFAVGVLWIWAQFLIPRSKHWLRGGIALMLLGALTAAVVALPAFQEWIHYDIHTTENASGWVEKVVGEIGGQFRSVFLAVYGITQPVLPAILVYPVTPACVLGVDKCTTIFWKAAGIFRSAGWYLLVPFLFYALFTTPKEKDPKKRAVLIVNACFVLGWLFLSSLRAGGDQWDNPRYRVIFLPWLAFFAAWGLDHALYCKDWWLARWIAIEMIFLGFFTQWYVSRYGAGVIRRFPFWKTVLYISLCSALVFATGLIDPIRKRLRKSERNNELP